MASEKQPYSADIQALASEVLDLWQEHLTAYATDPAAKAELVKLMEPQRRLVADWASMMQNGLYGAGSKSQGTNGNGHYGGADAPARAAAASVASDDGALRLAQFAHRLAEFEKRLTKLESKFESKGGKAPAKTPRRSKAS